MTSSEAMGVHQGSIHGTLPKMIRDVVKITIRVRERMVDGWWNNAPIDHQKAGNHLEDPGHRKGLSCYGFNRCDRNVASPFSKDFFNGVAFIQIMSQ